MKLLTRQQTADRLAVSLRATYSLPLTPVPVGRRSVRFDEADVDAYIRQQKKGAA